MSFGHTCSIGTTVVSLGKGWTKLNMPKSRFTSAREKQINDPIVYRRHMTQNVRESVKLRQWGCQTPQPPRMFVPRYAVTIQGSLLLSENDTIGIVLPFSPGQRCVI